MPKEQTCNHTNKDENVFDTSFWVFVGIFSILIGLICFFPYWLTKPAFTNNLDFSNTGEIGNTIGGTMSPFIAIAAALLTFIAFWVQFKANKQQTKQFKNQADDVSIERFENKFYEALRIQRENSSEIEIAEAIKGRRIFIFMFRELRFCYACTKNFIERYEKELGFDKTDEETIVDIAYHIFYMGIGEYSDKLVIHSLTGRCEQRFIADLIFYLNKNIKQVWQRNKETEFKVRLKDDIIKYSSDYTPLGGHISRLGRYFRHLFLTVNFIAEQDNELFTEDKKCNYAKTLRAQLSDHEQLLLFYSVCSTLGKAWISKGFIRRFRMIKNMPLPLADFGIIPTEKFYSDIQYWENKQKSFFEWNER